MSDPATSHIASPARIGDFDIVGTLGEGGSGIVYDARWGHREVALKVLHPALVATSKERDQFLAEARRLAEIHHAGVVKVLAVGQASDGRPYLAMEKLHGESLAARLTRGALPVGPALDLFAQLADAVDALHARGLVHRDLKPENVVLVAGVDRREHAVLLDFGIAKELAAQPSTTTQDGGVRGTPAYMAPERFFGQPASVATDVYELAVILFAMLAGRLPWNDVADPEVRLDPRRLAELAPHVPSGVDLEVRRALSTRAQNRPASAAELRATVMNAAGVQWAPRATVDVKSGPMQLPIVSPEALAATTSLRAPARKGRIALAFVGVAVAATAIGVAAHYLSKPDDALPTAAAAASAAPLQAATGTGTGTGSAAPAKDWIPEAIVAPTVTPTALSVGVAHLPDDERFAMGVGVASLDKDATLRPLLDMFTKSTPGVMLRAEANLDACSFDIRGRIDWAILGGSDEAGAIDMVASGRWTRDDIEQCLQAAVRADKVERQDRVSILHGSRGDRVVGWIDDHTFVLSSRAKADVAWMTGRLDDATPPAGDLGPMLGEIDTGATLWFAGDQAGSHELGIGQSSGMNGLWGTLASGDPVVMDVRARYTDAKAAKVALDGLQKTVGEMGMNESMGKVDLQQEAARPSVLHVQLSLSRMIAAVLLDAVQSGSLGQ